MKWRVTPNKNIRLQVYYLGLADGHVRTLKSQRVSLRDARMRRALSRLRMFTMRVRKLRAAEHLAKLEAEL